MRILLIILVIIGFLAGLYYCSVTKSASLIEGMTKKTSNSRCPDVLIQKGKKILLYNSKIAKVPGVNPIEFDNLEDYTEFLDWQRSQGINCPVLYLQHSYNTQGESTYRVRPSPTDLQGGLPPSKVDYDSSSNVIGPHTFPVNKPTPLSTGPSNEEGLLYSDDAMDDNWGGQTYTQKLVDKGYYSGNEVSIAIV